MSHYHLEKYFVPEDKNIYDMLDTCGTSIDKLWLYAKGFGIFLSPQSIDIQNIRSYVSRLTADRSKLLQLYQMNSTSDREEKYSNKVVAEKIDIDQIKAVAGNVKDERATSHQEAYTVRQSNENVIEISVSYLDPDLSRAEALQVREKEVKIIVERSDDKIIVRHHSNEKADEIAKSILKKLIPQDIDLKSVKTLSFVGIRDGKKRTQFFQDLAHGMQDFTVRDVPTLRFFHLSPNSTGNGDSDDEDEDEEVKATASIKKIFLSGTDIMHCPEYIDLEKRGYFIGAMSWIAEFNDEQKEHFEFTAAFNNPDMPTDLTYAATGKYARDEDGDVRKTKVQLSAFERIALMKALEKKAFSLYESLTEPPTSPADGNQA